MAVPSSTACRARRSPSQKSAELPAFRHPPGADVLRRHSGGRGRGGGAVGRGGAPGQTGAVCADLRGAARAVQRAGAQGGYGIGVARESDEEVPEIPSQVA